MAFPTFVLAIDVVVWNALERWVRYVSLRGIDFQDSMSRQIATMTESRYRVCLPEYLDLPRWR